MKLSKETIAWAIKHLDKENDTDIFPKPIELDIIKEGFSNTNKQIQALTQVVDESILKSYKLWPTNFIAYDILYKTDKFLSHYTENEKSLFERRLELKIDAKNAQMVEGFLAMYANPVVNKMKYNDAI